MICACVVTLAGEIVTGTGARASERETAADHKVPASLHALVGCLELSAL
jgi:hypothetical protein